MGELLRNEYCILAIALVTAVNCFWGCPASKDQDQRPNMIYIMGDDYTYQVIREYGGSLAENAPTLNFDRLTKEGVLFTRTIVTNSICTSSRAVLLTREYCFINGKVDKMLSFDWDQPNFQKLMQANRYQTTLLIHLDGIPQGSDFSRVLPMQGDYYNPDFLIKGERVREEGYCTEIITETTLDWLKNKRDPARPFCLLYHQETPHRNWQPLLRDHKIILNLFYKYILVKSKINI